MSSFSIILPSHSKELTNYTLTKSQGFYIPKSGFKSRIAFAAPHVVCDPLIESKEKSKIDWEATINYRKYLWSLGFHVAEAMDTSQRGMGLDWETSKELITNSLHEAKRLGKGIACGAGTDHLLLNKTPSIEEIIEAYIEQCDFIEEHGGRVILMASRALASVANSPQEYIRVYEKVLSHVKNPVILHWLGDMFDPNLSGYWGHSETELALEVCLDIISTNVNKINGIKVSLLDEEFEINMRRRLPEGVRMYTGDDFNYPSLIQGDESGYSDALLGIFGAIAPAAAAALHQLDIGDIEKYNQLLEPTVPLSRHIFKTPTFYYKTGIVFLAYLNGHQSHFRMIGGMENARSILHLSELFILADQAGLLEQPDIAVHRMKTLLSLSGVN